MEAKTQNGKWIKTKCHECGNEQIVYSRVSTKVSCRKCKAEIAVPTGGKSAIKSEVLELL